jgi:hypothetical protein
VSGHLVGGHRAPGTVEPMSADATHLDPALLEQLWDRADPGEAGAEPVSALFGAWCRTVGYDTTAKLRQLDAAPHQPLWGLDADALVDAALTGGYGGTCFPLAAGFAAAARAAGWDAEVRTARSDGSTLRADHAVTVVDAGGTTLLCDPAFVHLRPARIGSRVGQQCIVGPRWAPLWVHRDVDGVTFSVERGTSTARRRYRLGATISGDELRDAYDDVGRWPSGATPYVRRVYPDRQVVVDVARITTKGAGGLSQVPLDLERLDAQLSCALELDGPVISDLADQIRRRRAELEGQSSSADGHS